MVGSMACVVYVCALACVCVCITAEQRCVCETHVGQEAGFTVDPGHADEEVEDDLKVLWPAVCQGGPHVLDLRPRKLVPVLQGTTEEHTPVVKSSFISSAFSVLVSQR